MFARQHSRSVRSLALRSNLRAKRVLDVLMAGGGILLLSPILVVTSILLRLESRGPIFQSKTVYGYGGRTISFLKFSCRMTKLGKMLHETGIDELPILFNVLWGNLSIVGPAPFPSYEGMLGRNLSFPLLVFKPGLTGWTQMLEARHEARGAEQRVHQDQYYVENWSLFLDFRIVLAALLHSRVRA